MELIDVNEVYNLIGQSGVSRIHVSDIDRIRRIDPETLPIVQELKKQLEQVTKERDAAIKYLHGNCACCKNYTSNHNEGSCQNCKYEYYIYPDIHEHDNWEWKGV